MPRHSGSLEKRFRYSPKFRLGGIETAHHADEQRIGIGALQDPEIVFDPGTGFHHNGADDAGAGNLLAIGFRQRQLRRLPLGPGIRHALRAARIEQMNVGVDDRDGALRKNGRGGDSCRARQKCPPLHQCRSTLVTRQLPASAT